MNARFLAWCVIAGVLTWTLPAGAQWGAHWRYEGLDKAGSEAPGVPVHVELDESGTQLEEVPWRYRGVPTTPRAEYYVGSSPLCVGPCSTTVWSNRYYRVTGAGMAPSDPFTVPPQSDVRLAVTQRGNRGLRDAGGVLTVLGGLSFVMGASGFAASGGSDRTSETFLVTGLIALAVGLPVWISNWSVVESR